VGLWISGALLLGAVLSSPPSDRPYALYPLQPQAGLDRAAAAVLDDTLRQDLARGLGVTLFSRNDTAAMLRPEGGRLGLSCDTGALRCLTDLGQLLGAQKVIFGQVGPERVFLKLVDVESGGEERRVVETGLPAAELLEAAAVHLLAPKRYVGTVELRAPAGARVMVDGIDVGKAPLAPLSLIPGQHLIAATSASTPELHATVEVRYGQTAQVDLSTPASRGGLSPWGLGLLAGAAGFTVAGVVTGIISQSNRDGVSSMPYPVPASQAALVNQQIGNAHDYAVAANVCFVAAGVAAVAGLVVLLLDHPSPSSTGSVSTVSATAGGAAVHF
jgi:PEGA domain